MEGVLDQVEQQPHNEKVRIVQSATLLNLPNFPHGQSGSLAALASVPAGTAISSELSISADGAVSAVLRQWHEGSEDVGALPLLEMLAPAIAQGSRMVAGEPVAKMEGAVLIVPEWQNEAATTLATLNSLSAANNSPRIASPAVSWPWDIKRAMATLAAAGGGTLCLTAKVVERNARVIRSLTEIHERMLAATYADPEDRNILAAQLNCKAMLEDPALIEFTACFGGVPESDTLRHLLAMALYGTTAGREDPFADHPDPRRLTGSNHAPQSLLIGQADAANLIGSKCMALNASSKDWCIGTIAGGVPVTLSDRDRARHVHIGGGTGTGKTTLLCSTTMQDIRAGETVIFLDCHGDAAKEIEQRVPADRQKDLVYADAAAIDGGFSIDLLPVRGDTTAFEIVADTLVNLFKGLMYADTPEGFGPVWEAYFRNALALLVCASDEDRTLMNFPRVFSDRAFRTSLLARNTSEAVKDFWVSANRAGGDISLENVTPYIVSKFTRLIGSDRAQVMFPASEDCIDFDSAISENKVLILRCPKGVLGEGLAQLALSASVMKIRSAIMARSERADRKPVRIYIDEFQNCRGDSLQTLLAEGRKYGAALVLANQSWAQIGGAENASTGASILANVGNLITFRVGAPDAMRLAPWIEAPEAWRDLCRLPDFTFNARLLADGRPVQVANVRSPFPD